MAALTIVTSDMVTERGPKCSIQDHSYSGPAEALSWPLLVYCTHSASAGIAGVDLVWRLKSNRRHNAIATPSVTD